LSFVLDLFHDGYVLTFFIFLSTMIKDQWLYVRYMYRLDQLY